MDSIARQAKAQARIEQEDAQEHLEEQARRERFASAGKQTTTSQPLRKEVQLTQTQPTPIPPATQIMLQLTDTWVSVRWVSRQTALRQMGVEEIRTILDRYAQKGLVQKQGDGKSALYRCLFSM